MSYLLLILVPACNEEQLIARQFGELRSCTTLLPLYCNRRASREIRARLWRYELDASAHKRGECGDSEDSETCYPRHYEKTCVCVYVCMYVCMYVCSERRPNRSGGRAGETDGKTDGEVPECATFTVSSVSRWSIASYRETGRGRVGLSAGRVC
jgi:hypothetical protein